VRAHYVVGARRSCAILRINPSTFYYRPKLAAKNEALLLQIKSIAETRVHYGYRRIYDRLRMQGIRVNHKHVQRLYRLAGLGVHRRHPHRRRAAVIRGPRAFATHPNQVWSVDFVHDRLWDGKAIRFLTLIDTYTRECLALEARRSWRSAEVVEVLRQVTVQRGRPTCITCDNGSEFCALPMDRWAYFNDVKLDYSRPGKPVDNCYIESFNALVRRELLNASYFESLNDAQTTATKWQQDYNTEHPHSSLGHRSPQSFALRWIAEHESRNFTHPASPTTG
jgi:putative transposase